MSKRGNILVVDDDPSVRESVRAILAPEHEVCLAETAAQALLAVASQRIDTITLEPWLPGIQGRELLTRLRAASPRSRIIILSGQKLSLWFDDMVREEVFDYLPKPFERRTLLRAVERSLLRQRLGLSDDRPMAAAGRDPLPRRRQLV